MLPPPVKHTNIKTASLLHLLGLKRRPFAMDCDYRGDGFGTKGKSFSFMSDPQFIVAWEETCREVQRMTGKPAPDIRWRAHIALWAATNGLQREGDFVECGVFTGILSGVICRYLDFSKVNKTFWLFDTWEGIPTEALSGRELSVAQNYNKDYHRADVFDQVKSAFSAYPNCRLVRGFLPETLDVSGLEKVSYLSIDLNNAHYEKLCIEKLWPKLTSGAIVLLDDYNFKVCRPQQDMWDAFAAQKNLMIAALPTGQGILIKP